MMPRTETDDGCTTSFERVFKAIKSEVTNTYGVIEKPTSCRNKYTSSTGTDVCPKVVANLTAVKRSTVKTCAYGSEDGM